MAEEHPPEHVLETPWGPELQPATEPPETALPVPVQEEGTTPEVRQGTQKLATRHQPPPSPPIPAKSVPVKEQLFQRRQKAAQLHARGRSYRVIAKRLGVDVKTAYEDVGWYFREAARFFDAPTYRERLSSVQWTVAREAWKELRTLKAADVHRMRGKSPPLHVEARIALLEVISVAMERIAKMHGMSGEAAVSITQLNLGGPAEQASAPGWYRGLTDSQRRGVRDKLLDLRNAVQMEVSAAVVVEPGQTGGPAESIGAE